MHFSKILASGFAALAVAAPPPSSLSRRQPELGQSQISTILNAQQLGFINGGKFNLNSCSYLTSINGLGFNQVLDSLFAQLVSQGLDIGIFDPIFKANVLSVDIIVQVANLKFLHNLAAQGLFSGINLANLAIPKLQFGNLDDLVGFDLGPFIDQSKFANINAIAAQNALGGSFQFGNPGQIFNRE